MKILKNKIHNLWIDQTCMSIKDKVISRETLNQGDINGRNKYNY